MKVFGINLDLSKQKLSEIKYFKFLLSVGCVIFLIVLIGIIPNLAQLASVSGELNSLKSRSSTAYQKIRNLPQLRANEKKYLSDLEQIEKRFFAQDQAADLAGILSEIAKNSGVAILVSKQREFKLNETISKNPFYRPLLFKLQMEGNYHDFGKFVNQLERHDKWIQVQGINMMRSEERIKDEEVSETKGESPEDQKSTSYVRPSKNPLFIEANILTFIKNMPEAVS